MSIFFFFYKQFQHIIVLKPNILIFNPQKKAQHSNFQPKKKLNILRPKPEKYNRKPIEAWCKKLLLQPNIPKL